MSTNLNARPTTPSMVELIACAASVAAPDTRPASVIVYGPRGCGKTRHAEALAAHFGLVAIVDDWRRPPSGMIPAATLLLTEDRPRGKLSRPATIVRYEEAIAAIFDQLAEGQ